jgi:hypothetical protein
MTSGGGPITDEHDNPLVSLTGDGPEVHLDVFGTGFLASASGQILTNHHVVEPWWQNDGLKEMLGQGVEPVIAEMTAFFPGVPHGIAIRTETISSAADVAVVKGNVSELGIKQVALDDGRRSVISGGPIVLLGYPTALDAILARAGAETLESIATASKGDPKQVVEELARRNLIRPIVTQGHIGDVLRDKIVYDAQTTSGGSGGPLFDDEGKVRWLTGRQRPAQSSAGNLIPVQSVSIGASRYSLSCRAMQAPNSSTRRCNASRFSRNMAMVCTSPLLSQRVSRSWMYCRNLSGSALVSSAVG